MVLSKSERDFLPIEAANYKSSSIEASERVVSNCDSKTSLSSTTQRERMDITTEEGLRSYLSNLGYSCRSVQTLTGGLANFTYRVILDDDLQADGQSDFVVKHAEPYVRTIRSLSLPAERMDMEAEALQNISILLDAEPENDADQGLGSPGLAIRLPKVHQYDSDAHVLIMSSCGNITLKDAYDQLSRDQAQSVGKRLAKWLAVLHARTKNTSLGEDGNALAKSIYRYSYSNLQGVLAKHDLGGPNGELGGVVDSKFGALLAIDDDCVAHGDFWPGNIILDAREIDDGDRIKIQLAVVDWEMVRRGIAATDVGQFAAEAYLLDRFRNSRHGLASTFLRSYIEATDPSDEFLKRFAIHWGVHICFWPSHVEWADTAGTRSIAELGIKIMRMAMEDEAGWIQILLDEFDRYAAHTR